MSKDDKCTPAEKAAALVPAQHRTDLARSGDYVYDRMDGNPIENAFRMGKALALSKMFGVQSEAQGTVLALEAMHRQTSIMALAAKYHIISGKLSKRADAIQADFQADRGRIKWVERTATACEGIFSHPDFCPEGLEIRVTLDELLDAGVAGSKNGGATGNYKKYPRQMLHARCISEGVRAVHPAIVVGVYTPEEVEDFDSTTEPRDNRPPPAAPRVTERRTIREAPPAVIEATATVVEPTPDPQQDPGPPPDDPELNSDGTSEPDPGKPPRDEESEVAARAAELKKASDDAERRDDEAREQGNPDQAAEAGTIEPTSEPEAGSPAAKACSWLANFAITRQQVEAALGVRAVDWTEAQLAIIRAAKDAAKGKPKAALPAFLKSQIGIEG
jgi:hypothetical protein